MKGESEPEMKKNLALTTLKAVFTSSSGARVARPGLVWMVSDPEVGHVEPVLPPVDLDAAHVFLADLVQEGAVAQTIQLILDGGGARQHI